jgi:hypothetical protein
MHKAYACKKQPQHGQDNMVAQSMNRQQEINVVRKDNVFYILRGELMI